LPGIFNLTLVENPGVAFGLFKGFSLLLSVLGFLGLISIFIFFPEIVSVRHSVWFFGLIGGGALSNFFDRLVKGSVTDYLELTFFNVFNLADVAITAGVLLLLYDFVFLKGDMS
jgi:signal peptidase II